MITYRGTTFAEDTGYAGDGGFMPGVPEEEPQGGAGQRYRLRPRRHLLQRLAPPRPDPAGRRWLAAEIQLLTGSVKLVGPGPGGLAKPDLRRLMRPAPWRARAGWQSLDDTH